MFTIDEIKSLLRNGEKVNLECKVAESQVPKSIFETYSAFANTNGGTILLGIHENLKEPDPEKHFTITGVSDTNKIITDFWNTINGNKVNVNLLIDEDVYPLDFGFTFTNPGTLKLPKLEIYKGGNSKPRNPRMQTMLRFVGFGDNAGSGFPAILAAWAVEGWPEPELSENMILNQVTLTMFMKQEDEVESTPNSTPSTPLIPNLESFENKSLENKIFSLIRNDEHITRKEIACQTGASMYAVKKELARMKAAGVAEFVGFSRNGKWKIQ